VKEARRESLTKEPKVEASKPLSVTLPGPRKSITGISQEDLPKNVENLPEQKVVLRRPSKLEQVVPSTPPVEAEETFKIPSKKVVVKQPSPPPREPTPPPPPPPKEATPPPPQDPKPPPKEPTPPPKEPTPLPKEPTPPPKVGTLNFVFCLLHYLGKITFLNCISQYKSKPLLYILSIFLINNLSIRLLLLEY
jgi:hypothetical protein